MMNDNDVTIEQLVVVDRNMDKRIKELDDEIAEVEKQKKVIREMIAEKMKEQGVESLRTQYGTVTRGVTERYWTGDWQALHQYIMDHGAPELLEKRVAQTTMKEWILTHPDDFPPGLNLSREYTIKITKPRKKTGE